jgi:hypothetical protein
MSLLRKEEIGGLELSDSQIKHLSRHFDNDEMLGSKFYPSFADSPIELLAVVKRKLLESDSTFSWNGNRCEIILNFPDYIGTDSIVEINSLSEEQKKKVYKVKRESSSEYEVNAIDGVFPPKTKQLNVILIKKDSIIRIVTIFPGVMAPPLPNKKFQTEEQYIETKSFWDRYAFLK